MCVYVCNDTAQWEWEKEGYSPGFVLTKAAGGLSFTFMTVLLSVVSLHWAAYWFSSHVLAVKFEKLMLDIETEIDFFSCPWVLEMSPYWASIRCIFFLFPFSSCFTEDPVLKRHSDANFKVYASSLVQFILWKLQCNVRCELGGALSTLKITWLYDAIMMSPSLLG